MEKESDSISRSVIYSNESSGELSKLCSDYSQVVIISGKHTAKHWLEKVQKSLNCDSNSIVFESGENNKTLSTVENLCKELRRLGCDRKSLIISLGGGVTNDIVGFVAATYMRGVDWITIPTTVLAQADASIGGKTGVNLDGYKNMVGSFHMPKVVLIDPKYLKTLDKKYLLEGMGEIIKMGFIYNSDILKCLDKMSSDNISDRPLNDAIELAGKAKKEIVKKDAKESGDRMLVNFGHTIGHAVEGLSLSTDNPLLHGEAVAIGIIAEAKLAELEGVCTTNISDQISASCKRFALSTSVGLNPDDILARISSDKKNVGKTISWTLPTAVGKGTFDYQAKPENIVEAIASITN